MLKRPLRRLLLVARRSAFLDVPLPFVPGVSLPLLLPMLNNDENELALPVRLEDLPMIGLGLAGLVDIVAVLVIVGDSFVAAEEDDEEAEGLKLPVAEWGLRGAGSSPLLANQDRLPAWSDSSELPREGRNAGFERIAGFCIVLIPSASIVEEVGSRTT